MSPLSSMPPASIGRSLGLAPFEALGDPTRREILGLLGHGDRSVREIADALPISRPAVSRHLRLLKVAGLVAEAPQGPVDLPPGRPSGRTSSGSG